MNDRKPAGCLAALFGWNGSGGNRTSTKQRRAKMTRGNMSTATPTQYRVRDDFLSAAKFSFYRVLVQQVGDRALVCPKVNVADLLYVAQGSRSDRTRGRNRIDRKHVDFVLCEPLTMCPLAAIELDDSSHQRADRVKRDRLLDEAFASADLPLLRFPARRGYTAADLEAQLSPVLQPPPASAASPPELQVASTGDAPLCPSCGVPMVMREAKRGQHAGNNFFGCPNYLRCKRTVPLSELA
jgi:very-short-patch-repair endonuclease